MAIQHAGMHESKKSYFVFIQTDIILQGKAISEIFSISSQGEEIRAEHFMKELNNGVKLCRLVKILQSKIPQDCLLDTKQVCNSKIKTYV